MALIDNVREMQAQGLEEGQIAQKLKEQGFSPLDINQALEQARVRAAVPSPPIPAQPTPEPTLPPQAPTAPEPPTEPQVTAEIPQGEMQPSVMEQVAQVPTTPQAPAPEAETPEYVYPTPQPQYPEYQEYQPYQVVSSETMTEIAEQITEEKMDKIKKEITSLSNFRTTIERRTKDIDERLKKIEEIIDRLQATILGKIGSYGQNLQDIKKEMEMMQESFSKALPPLLDKTKTEEAETEKPTKRKTAGGKRRGDDFESYLR